MITPSDLDVTSYTDSAATLFTAGTAGGRTYRVILAHEEGLALVQPQGCSGWAEVRLDDLQLEDAFDLHVVAAVIDAAFER